MLLELLAKLPLIGKAMAAFVAIQRFLDGKKSYIAGSVLILQGLACLMDQVTAVNGPGGLLHLLKTPNGNECLTKMAEGLGIMGIRAGISKAGGENRA